MNILWDLGEATAAEVRRALAARRTLARNTVRTMLLRMEQKGWLRHRLDGRTFVYSPALPRKATIGQRVLDVIDTLCGGSPETLMTAILEYRGLTDNEAERIRAMLQDAGHRAPEGKGSS
jgi:predicted transcriptional regulator